ncbi:MAG: tRNA-binding protein [Fidelibacterota bacterium]|nr:MAG: tRNA-binding protein [Candidatus Neomarinimicrobiota bacterium]
MGKQITLDDFASLDIRVGTITEARLASKVHQPAYQLKLDFGELGELTSSVQITDHYQLQDLVGRQVVAVVNFPPRRIGGFKSQVLVLGAYQADGSVRLLQLDGPIEAGARLR